LSSAEKSMSDSVDSSMFQTTGTAIAATPNLRKAARRLRWFLSSFEQHVDTVSQRTGSRYRIDKAKLTETFIAWLRQFESQQAEGRRDRKEFTYFCAGLMLSELIRRQPVSLINLGHGLEANDPAAFWPEGYVYLAFCLNVAAAVLDQEFDHKTQLHPVVRDIEAWWSFKENASELPTLAIPFLDLFMGLRPSWESPSVFEARERFKDVALAEQRATNAIESDN
jgi:hypothetical protein